MINRSNYNKYGFTLIEMSIVLVIIGLIVGGILVGADMINAATIRSQVSQIEKYNTAVNTFRGKYGYLPGDIPDPQASSFGFVARGSIAGTGDGNGFIQGLYNGLTAVGYSTASGETALFWEDLSQAGLIGESLNTASATTGPASTVTGTAINLYVPSAKIGNANDVYVWSGSTNFGSNGTGANYFGLSIVSSIPTTAVIVSKTGLSVVQAYNIDKKIDDGMPQSGRVLALFDNGGIANELTWAGSGVVYSPPYTTATTGSSATCFDNGGNAGNPQQYSTEQNGGNGQNCALSFRFQ